MATINLIYDLREKLELLTKQLEEQNNKINNLENTIKNITSLNLFENNKITDEGIKHLTNCEIIKYRPACLKSIISR